MDTARAQMFLDAGRPREALSILSADLAEDPNDAQSLRMVAQAYLGIGASRADLSKARDAASRSLGIDAESDWGWRLFAYANTQLGLHQDARGAARTAARLNPHDWQNFTAIAHADAAVKYVDGETVRAVDSALRLAPDLAATHFAAGRISALQRDRAKAIEHYRRVLSLEPDNESARNNLAVIQLNQGDTGSAAAEFVGLLASNPAHRHALFNLRASARKSLVVVNLILWLSLAVAGVGYGNGLTVSAASSQLFAGIGAITGAMCLVGYVLWLRHRAGASFGPFVRSVPKADKVLTVWSAVLAACYCALVLAVFTPGATDDLIYEWLRGILAASVIAIIVVIRVMRPPPRG